MRKKIKVRVYSTAQVVERVHQADRARKIMSELRNLSLEELREIQANLGERCNFTLEKVIRTKLYTINHNRNIFA